MSLATYSAKIARSLDSEKITMVISGGGQEILRGTKSTSLYLIWQRLIFLENLSIFK
jgi:hypothetical protein